ncbi:retrotransposon protein, putative, ty1-copia subclass [Tanacetum coccineum]
MVQSMMNLTTLPLSFWDYALESATCILNMVPTKKVDKTPYELWYGKVPNLSYLKVWGCASRMWNWPSAWLVNALTLQSIRVPTLYDREDFVCWRDTNGSLFSFSVKYAWEALRPCGHEVTLSLRTQDKLKSWDVGDSIDLSSLRCSLCGLQPDSHEHLFFECLYSSNIWCVVHQFARMESVPPILEDIMLWFQPMTTKRMFKNIVGKLLFTATAYYVWLECNNSFFKNTKRTIDELKDLILGMVRHKLVTLRFKNKGCEALVKRDTPDKLEQRSVKCIFIGYPKETMGYYFYFPPENKIVVARYAEFFEKRLINQEISKRTVDLKEIQEEEDTTPSKITSNIPQEVEGFEPPQPPQEEVIPIRRSKRTHRAPNRLCLNVEVEEHSLGDLGEPANYKATMLDPESKKWVDAMNAEMKSMIDNMTDMDGNAHIYKARLVAKGYTQTYMVDYEETFSPVADIRAIRILISIAVFYDYKIWQMDVKTAFLNGYLDEDIYMVQPGAGFNNSSKLHWMLCKLLKYLRNTKDMFLVYGGNPCTKLRVECYCDAGFETDRDDTKSQTGYVFILNGGAVDWKSSKQSTIVMSAIESKYIAALEAAMKAVWIRKFISGLGIVPTINEPLNMYCDNSAVVHYANESGV